MSIKEDLAPFIVEDLMQADPNSLSGNGLLYTAEEILAYKYNRVIDYGTYSRWCKAYHDHQVEPGLIKRTIENKFGIEGPDDFFGCALFSSFCDITYAQKILAYGDKGVSKCSPDISIYQKILYYALKINGFGKIRYVYNNINPGFFTVQSWLGRMGHLITTLKFAAGYKPSFFEKIYWSICLLFPIDMNDYDKLIVPWIQTETVKGKSKICDFAIKIWIKRVSKYYKTPGELLEKYFAYKPHPVAKYLNFPFNV